MQRQTVKIINALGLHARAAAKLVGVAGHYCCHIELVKDEKHVNAKSIMSVMMLAATQGTELEIITDGEDEEKAMQELVALIENRFGEAE